VEALRAGDERRLHDASASQQPDRVIDQLTAVILAEAQAPLQPLRGGGVVGRKVPAVGGERGQTETLALFVTRPIRGPKSLQERVGVQLLLIPDLSPIVEREHVKPRHVRADERVMVVARRVPVELEEAACVRRVEEGLVFSYLHRRETPDASFVWSSLPGQGGEVSFEFVLLLRLRGDSRR